jgi:V8-like Glu-specific endopeptidase
MVAEVGGARDASVVNGTRTPTLVSLTAAEQLAVGAIAVRSGSSWETQCTATLVAPATVVTAAHCVLDDDNDAYALSALRFSIGEDAASPSATFTPTALHVHSGYDPDVDTAAGDVAVLELDPARSELAAVTPLPFNCGALPSSGFTGTSVQTVGYGCTDTDCDSDISRRYWAKEKVTALSTSDFTVDGGGVSGVCFGDSGGPALWQMSDGVVRVVGTLSWGYEPCASEDHFARADGHCAFVGAYVDFDGTGSVPLPDENDGCTVAGVALDAGQRACVLSFFAGMTCQSCDAVLDSRVCEDAIDDAGLCKVGSTCTGCGDGDGRSDGLSCAEIAGYSYLGAAGVQAILTGPCSGQGAAGGEPQVVEGVSFTAAEAAAVLALANAAPLETLDDEVGLDSRAAANIVAARPLVDLQALAAVPYVGASALEKLKAYAAAH